VVVGIFEGYYNSARSEICHSLSLTEVLWVLLF